MVWEEETTTPLIPSENACILLDSWLTELDSHDSRWPHTMKNLQCEAKSINHVWFYPHGLAMGIPHQNFPAHVKWLSKPPREAVCLALSSPCAAGSRLALMIVLGYFLPWHFINKIHALPLNIDHIIFCGTNIKKFSILYQGAKVWNSLPVTLVSSLPLSIKKKKLKNYLIERQLFL